MHLDLSVIIPVFRNRSSLLTLHRRLIQVLEQQKLSFEILFINDACPDNSLDVLKILASSDERVGVISLLKNSGQNAALLVGLMYAQGDSIVTMDADLQDEPECIPGMLDALQQGYDAVFAGKYGAYESPFRILSSRLFKLTLNVITLGSVPLHSGLFIAMKQNTVKQILSNAPPDPHLITLIGLTKVPMYSIPTLRPPRPEGKSSYSFIKRMKVAFCALSTLMHVFLFKKNKFVTPKFITYAGQPFQSKLKALNL